MDMKHIRRVNKTLFFYKYPYKGYKEIKMKSLSQSEYGEIRDLYSSVYATEEIIEEELVHEICDELVEELVAEGYSEDDAIALVEDAANDYIDEAKVTFGKDTTPMRKSGAPVGARRRFAMRKAGDAVKKAGSAVKGAADRAVGTAKAAKAGAEIAGSIAKDEVRRAGRKAVHSATKAADAVKSAPGKARDKAKKGIKGFLKRQAEKVVKRMSEEVEALKATGLFSDSEIEAIMEADSLAAMQARREKRLAAQRKREGTTASGRDFGHDYSLSADQQKKRRDAEFKAGMKKEEVEAVDEAMSSYDRNRKRAAQRAAERNAARAAGKTGVVPGVGYVSPRRERETYVDSAGTTRHKSGAKMPKD